ALQKTPWLGNLFEFEGSIVQEHTQSHELDTKEGTHHRSLHSDLTKAALHFTPQIDLSVEAELNLAKTQDHDFGFDSLKGSVRYLWLNDIAGDIISIITGAQASISPRARVADLSSQNHGVLELETYASFGKEFGYSDSGFFRTWFA